MNYPLENLGPQRFQQICQSLVAKTFPSAQCYPVDQPDGGRDITSSGNAATAVPHVIYQVKYTKTALKDRQPHKSIVDQLRTEIPLKASSINAGSANYVLMTNVPGTANSGSGSIAAVQKLLSQHLSVPAQCWWRDDIERRLDDAWDIKWAFPEVLRNQDFISHSCRTTLDRGCKETGIRPKNRHPRSVSLRHRGNVSAGRSPKRAA